jgi:TatA/E family protein of Tat protein translocase
MSIYFLFLESLGTPELLLIMLVALIVFGPRKLPSLGRTIGKYTSEFKRASRDFRETWEREVQEAESDVKSGAPSATTGNSPEQLEADFTPSPNGAENTIGRGAPWLQTDESETFTAATSENDSIALPEVRAVDSSDFHALQNGNSAEEIAEPVEVAETAPPQRKRDWL